MSDFSFVANAHPNYISNLYDQYQTQPESVDEGWSLFFRGFDYAAQLNGNGSAPEHGATAAAPTAPAADGSGIDRTQLDRELRTMALIRAYRNRGHLEADTNPIRPRRDRRARLQLADFDLNDADLDVRLYAGREIGCEYGTLREIVEQLRKVYLGHIGFEFQHLNNRDQRRWLRTNIEHHHPDSQYELDLDTKRRILEKLNDATIFEQFLHTKYIGQKRFSVEGGESVIAGVDALITAGAEAGAREVVIGMAHRGRLNVLVNIMGKTYGQVFNEFEEAPKNSGFGDGDVKYHLGFGSTHTTPKGKKVSLKLMPNPSHLESVDPVVEGFARAKADLVYNSEYDTMLPILIHGDAAVVGQGVVYETAQMSRLEGYYTGGTIHFVINIQVGFTTDYKDARSSVYSTAAAKAIGVPVFHVNGDDPEAVVFAAQLAIAYRQEFHEDVFIDMVCYRKYGHNEGDDPNFTQPGLYKLINEHENVRDIYSNKLTERGQVEQDLASELKDKFWADLQNRLDEVKEDKVPYEYQEPELAWKELKFVKDPAQYPDQPTTGIERERAEQIVQHLLQLPKDFDVVSKVKRVVKGKKKLWDNQELDWAMGELLAYGSILLENKNVRMSGQDVRRGTFSHRHAVLNAASGDGEYNRLNDLGDQQGTYYIYNSLLSEFAVMGFEYGYSLAGPDQLVLWEAQFGDFYNGAQTIVDQYLSAAEMKWRRMSGLVLLLPHGYEGQGPEHSSARLERFLQMCAEFNMYVANVTSPANFFHLLRRQLAQPFRKPLVVMSPKSGLRHPEVISKIDDFCGDTKFQPLLDDPNVGARSGKKIKRVLLCSGKVYFDLLQHQRDTKANNVAVVRLEQLYPLPEQELRAVLKRYPNADFMWVQEEPENMGAWRYMHHATHHLDWKLQVSSRKASASPATGYKDQHKQEQAALVERAFDV